ncbi:hypothetical protein [Candidatus Contendibacter odensensis]|uniref:DUF5666 domain-containing protein n=1 Tax=Candidatus Contendobacter odensis Run_B_J11 TaxID=1400861 RepID=A0A7U7GAZ4_9GAMM|nr:hypothetical protein [Candidatus Contendobacter odensis]CDH45109.1 exported hypothetical protein [Candidatus Contendobacter odensis Run_B_J11]
MRFIQRFDTCRGSVWVCLLVVALLVATPLHAEEVFSVVGQITAVDVVGRAIEIDGARYTLAPQAEIKNASSETQQAMNITDLKVGQYVKFTASGNIIQNLRIFNNGPPI